MRQMWTKLFLPALCLALPLGAAEAQSDGAFLKYRQKLMQAQSASMGAIGHILKNKLPFRGHIATHAKGLNGLSKLIPEAFKKEITAGRTDAKQDVWKEWDKFVAASEKLGQESAKLAEVAASGDMGAIGAQMKAVSASCGGCHKFSRKPKGERFKR